MFRPLQLFIGLRYVAAERRNHFISFISLISMLGIALGIATLITVISVMNGFQQELRSRILGMTAHATVYGYRGGLENWPVAKAAADGHPSVVGAAPFIQGEGMITVGGRVSGVLIRGVEPALEPQVTLIGERMLDGRLDDLQPGGFGIVLGAELMRYLGVSGGDKVTVITPQALATPAGILPRMKRFTVVGAYEIGMHEYDRSMAVMHLADAATLFRLGARVTGVRLQLKDMFRARDTAREVAESLPGIYAVRDWTQEHKNFFRAIATEKIVMFIILFLIVAVAAFNIVSTLVMVVTDKQSDIAILRTLGMSPAEIMAVFMVQGTLIGVIGVVIGTAGGIALAAHVEHIVPALEGLLQVQFLPPDVYYISDLPSRIEPSDVAVISGVSLAFSVVATLYPAWQAARIQPAQALRHE